MIADLQGKIRGNWDPPSSLGVGVGSRNSVQIRMTLTRDGRIRDPRIVRSSGSRAVDDSVMLAITSLRDRITAPPKEMEFILDFQLF